MSSLQDFLNTRLAERRAQRLYRSHKLLDAAPGPLAEVDGRALVTFSSNDYLGLATHPQVIAAQQRGAQLGAGATASHLVNGHFAIHQQLQHMIAAMTGREAALLFGSGYMANVGVINALVGRGDFVLQDKLNHASLIDGGRLCGAQYLRFAHNDLDALETQLKRAREKSQGNILLAVDGVYSMDGDTAPLAQMATLCQQYDAWLMVDEAHGFGVMGSLDYPSAGSAAAAGLDQHSAPVVMGTLGKAAGNGGAFVAGSQALIDYLTQFARTYIYTTGMPPAVAAGCLRALELMQVEPLRQTLQDRIDYFRQRAAARALPLENSTSAIQPLVLGCESAVLRVAEQLQHAGYLVGAIRPPTVPAGTARLRITLSAAHSEAHIDGLIDALVNALNSCEVAL
ncbi:8-amino-7-oxononanoate synthase [Microbulbifer salipaludis]|uniref:8-amino-7-oxononanoate synthase n=1 Tax=Microbulbifer salipaludis TaxID=187980 RepID=A0ABS3E3R3_9GAMM|nr:8-amino-7-oxononanoate synthase [Microbulbifer salipaludis]MBN8429953.1 8-amino-7-oxononanoate synthase [Microbulbifer salipaludis]